jgi:serine/threonine protein kinase
VTHAPTDLVGTTVGPYQLERLLGQGGFAWVFAGRDADGTPVAVKLLKPRYAGDLQFETRFRNEAELAAKLRHPRIIPIRAVARAGGDVYFAMELCPDSLGARIERDGPLPEPDLARIARQVAEGLQFAHGEGVIHRDLKPDNILLRADGSAVISDFGIARTLSGYVASTGVNMTIGTPQYLSPEQAQGRALDQRLDFYALGVTLFKAATGELPFRSSDWFELARLHVEQPPPSLRKKRPELSKRLERMVRKCLAKHPDDRYRDATELLAALTAIDTSPRAGGTTRTAGVGTRAWRAVRDHTSWRWVVGAGVLLVALALLLITWLR